VFIEKKKNEQELKSASIFCFSRIFFPVMTTADRVRFQLQRRPSALSGLVVTHSDELFNAAVALLFVKVPHRRPPTPGRGIYLPNFVEGLLMPGGCYPPPQRWQGGP